MQNGGYFPPHTAKTFLYGINFIERSSWNIDSTLN